MLDAAVHAVSLGCIVFERFNWREISKWSKKGDPRDLVSEADRAIETAVREFLLQETPEIPLIGEEFSPDTIVGEGKAWILDPIDGTSNFLQGFEHFTISLGLISGGFPEIGVVCNPIKEQIYSAQRECGAFMNGTRISSSQTTKLAESFICLEWGRDEQSIDLGLRLLKIIAPMIRDYRFFGGAAQTIAHVAEGKLDLYIDHGLKIWDYAAGWCLVSEAGGALEIIDLDGEDIVIVGGNKLILKTAASLIKRESVGRNGV